MSHPAASAPWTRAAKLPLSAFIERSSVISTPSKPISSRIRRTSVADCVAGSASSAA
jgi:hypothetical protein